MIKFSWNPDKAAANQKKHGVSFEEAQSVFYDEFAIQFYDAQHSATEDRFLMLGLSSQSRIIIVCHCEHRMPAIPFASYPRVKQPKTNVNTTQVTHHEKRI